MTDRKGKNTISSTETQETFVFTNDNLKHIDEIISKYPPGRQASAILPLLDLAQRQSGGWLPKAAIEAVALILNIPVIRTFEVATFYTMFNLTPVGKHHIQVCGTMPCWLRGSSEVMSLCERHLGIPANGVTADGKFSLKQVECLGACVNAPVVQINDDYYEDLTPEAMKKILQNLATGKTNSAKDTPSNTHKKNTNKDTLGQEDEGAS